MKILSLELLRWGPFSDLALDFSSPARALHVVVGSNEAGKSTTLRAVTGLFFGIPERTTDDHRHKKPDLRIGGRIGAEDGAELSVVRRKGHKKTLLDAKGEAVEEEQLRRLLGNLEQGQFETMFGLSHDRLVEGGRALVEGRGDLGESLFGAGLGQTGLSALLRKLEQRAEDIFVPRGRTKKLNHVIEKFKKAKDDQKSLSQPVRAWEEHKKDLDAQRERASAALIELEALQRDVRRLSRIKRALRPIAERGEILLALEVRQGVVLLPESAAEDRRMAEKILRDSGPREEQLAEDVRRLDAKLAALSVPGALLDKGLVVRQIREELGSHRKASVDGTRLRGELRQVEDEVRVISARLGREVSVDGANLPSAEEVLLPAALDRRVRALIKQKVELDAGQKSAEQAFAAAEDRLAGERRRGAALPAPAPVTTLARALELAQREGDLDKRIRERSKEADQLGQRVRTLHAALALFELAFDRIGTLPMPSRETIERFERLVGGKEEELRAIERTLAEKRRGLSSKARELEQERRGGEVPTALDLAAARASRDGAWLGLRRALLGQPFVPSSDAVAAFRAGPEPLGVEALLDYEASIRRADDLADRLFREADRVARVTQLALQKDGLEREIAELEANRVSLEAERGEALERFREKWVASGITPLSPAEMKDFLVQYERLADDVQRWRDIEKNLGADRLRAADHAEALAAALLPPAEASEGIAALIERARAACEREDRAQKEREAHARDLERRQADVEQARVSLERQRAELGAWTSKWSEAAAEMGLPPATGPAEAEEVLVLFGELTKRCQDAQDKRRRIAGIERDARAFADRVAEVARVAAPDLTGAAVEPAAVAIVERFSAAEKDDVERRAVAQQLEEKRRELAEAILKRRAAENDLAALCSAARVPTAGDLPMAEERSKEVRDLRARLDPLVRQLLDVGEGLGIDALVAECHGFTGDDVATALRSVEEKIVAANNQRAQIDQEIGKLEERLGLLDGSGKAAEAAEESEQHLAAMATLVEEYARARLAHRLLEDEIKQYREKHQGPIVRRASEVFERLTLGSFVAIRGDDDGEEGRPILKCVRPEGSLVGVEGLSDGTRDQLFFALRMASLERHFEHNEPIPFVLDDILVNFDDARSRAALSILGELSQKTQVLFFTHHARVADLAREAMSPSRLCLHDLDMLGGRARLRPAS